MLKNLNYYILLNNYTEGMKIQEEFRRADIKSRIAPTPSCIHDAYGCGMCILVDEKNINKAKNYINENKLKYLDIVSLENKINPNRDMYC